MTSTSFASFSESVPEAFNCGGGESIAAIFFLFLVVKKLPKKPEPVSEGRSSEGLAARGGTAGGSGLPVFGSTCVGLLVRSLTMAIAFEEKNHVRIVQGRNLCPKQQQLGGLGRGGI